MDENSRELCRKIHIYPPGLHITSRYICRCDSQSLVDESTKNFKNSDRSLVQLEGHWQLLGSRPASTIPDHSVSLVVVTDEFMKLVDAVNGMRPPGIQTSVFVWRKSGQIVGRRIHVPAPLTEASIDESLELSQ